MTVAKRKMEDRLSDLPEALQLRVLASLDTKQAVQTSVLSRTWVSLWTRIPVLEFNYFHFNKKVLIADKFINWVLCGRDHLIKLDSLKFNCDGQFSTAEITKSVLDYAFSHGVKQLEVSVKFISPVDAWPVSLCDSLTSLKLESLSNWPGHIKCPFLGPRSILFKNLTVLYLTYALITDVEPFSGFPVLESLTLNGCELPRRDNENKTLRVHALRLSDFTISHCMNINYCELRTPKLRYLKYEGSEFPKHEDLVDLETVVIDIKRFNTLLGKQAKEPKKRLIDNMMSLFSTYPSIFVMSNG